MPDGRKGASILCTEPNIIWKKDPGKEPTRDQAQFTQFGKDDKFTGERINDALLSNTEKQKAQERAVTRRHDASAVP